MEASQKPLTVLSCIQPTGDLHLGNYLGAIRNWKNLQTQYDCIYGVVDNHSMTMAYNPVKLRQQTWNMAFQLLACGIEAERIFIQSMIPEHTDLCWILSCVCSHGELTRMTQFKDKSQLSKESSKDSFISAGLLFYPILQAADILIYNADYVPVGKDQEQHLELTRNIVQRFNHQFNTEYFRTPEPLFSETPKVYSLADPNRKMSKSLGEKHYINLFGSTEKAIKQIKSAVTDAGDGQDMSPGVKNLFEIHKAVGDQETHNQLWSAWQADELKYSTLKQELAGAMQSFLAPFHEKYAEIQANKKAYKDIIKQSSSDIRKRAVQTMKDVREIVGMANPARI